MAFTIKQNLICTLVANIIMFGAIGVFCLICPFAFCNVAQGLFNSHFELSQAASSIDLHLNAVHRDLKNVLLARNPSELHTFSGDMNTSAVHCLAQLTITRSHFLASSSSQGLALTAEILVMFDNWASIRSDIVTQMTAGNIAQARTRSKTLSDPLVHNLTLSCANLKGFVASQTPKWISHTGYPFAVLAVGSFLFVVADLVIFSLAIYRVNHIFKWIWGRLKEKALSNPAIRYSDDPVPQVETGTRYEREPGMSPLVKETNLRLTHLHRQIWVSESLRDMAAELEEAARKTMGLRLLLSEGALIIGRSLRVQACSMYICDLPEHVGGPTSVSPFQLFSMSAKRGRYAKLHRMQVSEQDLHEVNAGKLHSSSMATVQQGTEETETDTGTLDTPHTQLSSLSSPFPTPHSSPLTSTNRLSSSSSDTQPPPTAHASYPVHVHAHTHARADQAGGPSFLFPDHGYVPSHAHAHAHTHEHNHSFMGFSLNHEPKCLVCRRAAIFGIHAADAIFRHTLLLKTGGDSMVETERPTHTHASTYTHAHAHAPPAPAPFTPPRGRTCLKIPRGESLVIDPHACNLHAAHTHAEEGRGGEDPMDALLPSQCAPVAPSHTHTTEDSPPLPRQSSLSTIFEEQSLETTEPDTDRLLPVPVPVPEGTGLPFTTSSASASASASTSATQNPPLPLPPPPPPPLDEIAPPHTHMQTQTRAPEAQHQRSASSSPSRTPSPSSLDLILDENNALQRVARHGVGVGAGAGMSGCECGVFSDPASLGMHGSMSVCSGSGSGAMSEVEEDEENQRRCRFSTQVPLILHRHADYDVIASRHISKQVHFVHPDFTIPAYPPPPPSEAAFLQRVFDMHRPHIICTLQEGPPSPSHATPRPFGRAWARARRTDNHSKDSQEATTGRGQDMGRDRDMNVNVNMNVGRQPTCARGATPTPRHADLSHRSDGFPVTPLPSPLPMHDAAAMGIGGPMGPPQLISPSPTVGCCTWAACHGVGASSPEEEGEEKHRFMSVCFEDEEDEDEDEEGGGEEQEAAASPHTPTAGRNDRKGELCPLSAEGLLGGPLALQPLEDGLLARSPRASTATQKEPNSAGSCYSAQPLVGGSSATHTHGQTTSHVQTTHAPSSSPHTNSASRETLLLPLPGQEHTHMSLDDPASIQGEGRQGDPPTSAYLPSETWSVTAWEDHLCPDPGYHLVVLPLIASDLFFGALEVAIPPKDPFPLSLIQEYLLGAADLLSSFVHRHGYVEQLIHLVAYSRDINEELWDANTRLDQRRRELEHAASMKEQFLCHISHEIRTPLHGVTGLLNLMLESPTHQFTTAQRELLLLTKEASDGLLCVIGDVLDLSKIETGKLVLHPAPFRLRSAIGALLDVYKRKCETSRGGRVTLEWHCERNVPECLIGDKQRFDQILINLVDNAFKFTKRGKIRVQVRLATRRRRRKHKHTHLTRGGSRSQSVVTTTGVKNRNKMTHRRRHNDKGSQSARLTAAHAHTPASASAPASASGYTSSQPPSASTVLSSLSSSTSSVGSSSSSPASKLKGRALFDKLFPKPSPAQSSSSLPLPSASPSPSPLGPANTTTSQSQGPRPSPSMGNKGKGKALFKRLFPKTDGDSSSPAAAATETAEKTQASPPPPPLPPLPPPPPLSPSGDTKQARRRALMEKLFPSPLSSAAASASSATSLSSEPPPRSGSGRNDHGESTPKATTAMPHTTTTREALSPSLIAPASLALAPLLGNNNNTEFYSHVQAMIQAKKQKLFRKRFHKVVGSLVDDAQQRSSPQQQGTTPGSGTALPFSPSASSSVVPSVSASASASASPKERRRRARAEAEEEMMEQEAQKLVSGALQRIRTQGDAEAMPPLPLLHPPLNSVPGAGKLTTPPGSTSASEPQAPPSPAATMSQTVQMLRLIQQATQDAPSSEELSSSNNTTPVHSSAENSPFHLNFGSSTSVSPLPSGLNSAQSALSHSQGTPGSSSTMSSSSSSSTSSSTAATLASLSQALQNGERAESLEVKLYLTRLITRKKISEIVSHQQDDDDADADADADAPADDESDSDFDTEPSSEVHLVISVYDTGIGIGKDALQHIFEGLYHSSTDQHMSGSGLGLAIARRLCTMMGGRIHADSTLNRGSAFTFTVVLQRDPNPTEQSSSQQTLVPQPRLPKPIRPLRVLLVEDTPINRMVAERTVTSLGWTIASAEDGQVGVNAWTQSLYDTGAQVIELLGMRWPPIAQMHRIVKEGKALDASSSPVPPVPSPVAASTTEGEDSSLSTSSIVTGTHTTPRGTPDAVRHTRSFSMPSSPRLARSSQGEAKENRRSAMLESLLNRQHQHQASASFPPMSLHASFGGGGGASSPGLRGRPEDHHISASPARHTRDQDNKNPIFLARPTAADQLLPGLTSDSLAQARRSTACMRSPGRLCLEEMVLPPVLNPPTSAHVGPGPGSTPAPAPAPASPLGRHHSTHSTAPEKGTPMALIPAPGVPGGTPSHTLYDLIFMDIQMPVLDGFGATHLIRTKENEIWGSVEVADQHRIPIIALTAHILQGYREKCIAAGFTEYLGKPFKKQDLVAVCQKVLPGMFHE